MPAPTFYLETSIWGSLAPRQPRDRKQIVRQLLDLLDGIRGRCAISEIVHQEIAQAPSEVVAAIRPFMTSVQPVEYAVTTEVDRLAQAYLATGILPARRLADATHVALASFHQLDFLVSWNHRHLTRPSKRLQFQGVNQLHGFLKTPAICNPWEACDEIRSR